MTADTFRAFVATKTDDGFHRGVTEMTTTDLPGDGVLIDVEWSSVNYKDALASTPDGRVARISPLVPGIDLAGRLAEHHGLMPTSASPATAASPGRPGSRPNGSSTSTPVSTPGRPW